MIQPPGWCFGLSANEVNACFCVDDSCSPERPLDKQKDGLDVTYVPKSEMVLILPKEAHGT